MGPAGTAGVKGATGSTGATGVVGVVPCWVTYRVFSFDSGRSEIRSFDTSMVADMAAYLKKNPSLQIGIDDGTDSNAQLGILRVNAVRDALIRAGVRADRIQLGAFGEAKNRQSGRVEVLLKTIN
jgi:outer membrane protein OmpA-like peptidoglycan-associated protein